MSKEYIKIWLLEDFATGYSWGDKGTTRYWKIIEEYDNGDVIVTRGSKRALLWAEDVEAGERHSKPDFHIPTGLHLGLERGYRRRWWGGFYKPVTESVTTPPPLVS